MNYATIKNCDIANGPGVRVSLFVSGCTHRCPGCFNEVAWDFSYGEPFTEQTIQMILNMMEPAHIKGLTLLGGEPFEPQNQPAIVELLRQVKGKYPDKSIWAFSGYLFDKDILAGRLGPWEVTEEFLSYLDVLVDGYSRAAEAYIDRLQWNPQWGYSVVGILDDHMPEGSLYKGVKLLGGIDELNNILPENGLDEIAVALSLKDYDRLEEIVGVCEKSGVHTKFVPDYNSLIPSRPYTEDMMGLPVINIRYVPLSNAGNAFLKRVMDVAGSIFGIIITSPLLLLIAVLIKITSPGPIIFKQERVGLHNKSFYMYKFRSMELQPEEDEKKAWTVKNDPRVTPIGRFIRRTSIDELPQLFNILKGDMSLVGPRPERPLFVEKFKEEIPRYMIKHQIRPGLTGWAQVNGYRGDTSILKRIEYDLYYIENWTVGLDVKIILLTFITGFVNKNAY